MLMLGAERGPAPSPPALPQLGWGAAGPPGLPAAPTVETCVPPRRRTRWARGCHRGRHWWQGTQWDAPLGRLGARWVNGWHLVLHPAPTLASCQE